MKFSYQLNKIENCTIILFDGTILDKSEANTLQNEIDGLMMDGENRFIVDFNKIDYINSSGLSVLISLLNKTKENNGLFCLCNVSEKVHKLILTCKLENILKIEGSLKEAIKKIQS